MLLLDQSQKKNSIVLSLKGFTHAKEIFLFIFDIYTEFEININMNSDVCMCYA